jgi:hypothetical protein
MGIPMGRGANAPKKNAERSAFFSNAKKKGGANIEY